MPRAIRGGRWLSPPASPDRVPQRNVDARGAEATRPPRRRCRHDPVLGGAGDGAADLVAPFRGGAGEVWSAGGR